MPRGKDAPPFGGSVETRGKHFNMIWFKFSFCDQMKSARPSIPPSSMFHEGEGVRLVSILNEELIATTRTFRTTGNKVYL